MPQVALELARRRFGPHKLGGCVAVSAALLPEALLLRRPPPPPPHTPVLLTAGELDPELPAALVQATVAALGAGAHAYVVPGKVGGMLGGADEVRECMRFWASTLQAPPPPGTEEVGA